MVEIHPERLLFQWMEIKSSNGGLNIHEKSIGQLKTTSALASIILFYLIFPTDQNGKKTVLLVRISCYVLTAIFVLMSFARYLSDDGRLIGYFIWNFLHQCFVGLLHGMTVIMNAYFIPMNLLGQFYSIAKFVSFSISVLMFFFMGEIFTFVLKNKVLKQIFGKAEVCLVFFPFAFLFLVILKFDLSLGLEDIKGKTGEAEDMIVEEEAQEMMAGSEKGISLSVGEST